MATSNEKFLLSIQYTLEDILEFSDNENEIWTIYCKIINKV